MVKYPAERVPFPQRDGLAASIRALGHGESFLVPEVKETTRRVIHATAVRLEIPVSVRKVEGGLRVYRLEEWPRRGKTETKVEEYKQVDESQDWGA